MFVDVLVEVSECVGEEVLLLVVVGLDDGYDY